MAKMERPLQGGSYIRNKDGSLKRVGGTEPAKPQASAKPAETASAEAVAPAEPETSKKGK